jgi:hypothetical protein
LFTGIHCPHWATTTDAENEDGDKKQYGKKRVRDLPHHQVKKKNNEKIEMYRTGFDHCGIGFVQSIKTKIRLGRKDQSPRTK